MNEHFQRFIAKARLDRDFWAYILSMYASNHRLTDAELMAQLAVDEEQYRRLQLCRAPRNDPDGYRRDVQAIADRMGIALDILIQMSREVMIVDRLQGDVNPSTEKTWLLAARDHEEDPGEPP